MVQCKRPGFVDGECGVYEVEARTASAVTMKQVGAANDGTDGKAGWVRVFARGEAVWRLPAERVRCCRHAVVLANGWLGRSWS